MAHSATPIDDKRQSGEAAPEAPPRGRSVAHLRPGSKTWALNVLGIGAILAFCYFAEETLVVILVSILIAFILDPVANFFTRLHRSEEHTSELQSQSNLVCRLLLEKKK